MRSGLVRLGLIALFALTSASAWATPEDCARALTARPPWIVRVYRALFGRRASNPAAESTPPSGGWPSPAPKSGASSPATADEDYEVRNVDSDTAAPVDPARVTHRFNRAAVVYFAETAYPGLDANSGRMRTRTRPVHLVPHGPVAGELVLDITTDHLSADGGALLIPFGFEPTMVDGPLDLRVGPFGTSYRRTGRQSARVKLAPRAPADLGPTERTELLEVSGAPPLERYPPAWREVLTSLAEQRREGHLNDAALARELAAFIAKTLLYEVDASPERGVLAMIGHGAVQCDGASLILVTLLRSIFRVPALAVGGVRSVRPVDEFEASVVLDQAIPHMFTAVYDQNQRQFVVIDPTPGEQTRAKDNPGREDPRFEEWPSESEGSSEAEGPDEAEDGPAEPTSVRPRAPTSGGRGAPRQKLDVDQRWRDLFAVAHTPAWWDHLHRIDAELAAGRVQNGLSPEHDLMAHNVKYVLELGQRLPRESLDGLARAAAETKSEDEAIKMDYLRLQILWRVATYGTRYAARPLDYRALTNAADGWLRLLPPAAPFNEATDLAPRLPGEFSRAAILRHPERLHIFRQLAALHARIRPLRVSNLFPRPYFREERSFSPTDHDDYDLTLAEDFEHAHLFERQGLPPKYDALRVFGDDMYIREYRDRVAAPSDEFEEISDEGRELTFVLLDLSGSMQNDRRGEIRDRIAQAWVDELMSDHAEAEVRLIGYRGTPDAEMVLDTRAKGERQFGDMLRDGEVFHSNGGNDTVHAIRHAVDLAHDAGQRLKRVNFRLVTDGEETFNLQLLRDAKDRLGAGVELNFSAVTLVTGNTDLEKFIRQGSDADLVREGHFNHLDAAEILRLMEDPASSAREALDRWVPANFRELNSVASYVRRALTEAGGRAVVPAQKSDVDGSAR